MGVGKSGATNAAIFTVEVLALTEERLAAKLTEYKAGLEQVVADKSKKIQES